MNKEGKTSRWLRHAVVLGWLMLPATGLAGSPEDLGYHRASIGEEEKVRLLAGRIIRGVRSNDPYLYLRLLADDYMEVRLSESQGTARIGNGLEEPAALSSERVSRQEFLEAALQRKPAGPRWDGVRLVRVKTGDGGNRAEAVLHTRVEGGLEEQVRLFFERRGGAWQVVRADGLLDLVSRHRASHDALLAGKGPEQSFTLLFMKNAPASSGQTFIYRDLAPEHDLPRLNRQVTQDRLDRDLFSMPYGSTLYARVRQFDSAPYYEAAYVQMVTDPAWDRVVYGDYQRWIKSYGGEDTDKRLNRPHGIATDERGRVYLADTGNGRILILQLTGSTDDLSLSHAATIGQGHLSLPTEVAWDDRGTIFDASDDLLWVVDRGTSSIIAFRLSSAYSQPLGFEDVNAALVNPTALAMGRFDGRSDGNIYVADAGARRVHRYYFDGETLTLVASRATDAEAVPTSLATDHWGNLYMVDAALGKVHKLSPTLEPLAALRHTDASFRPQRFQTIFGSVHGEDGRTRDWSGYDQAFVLEDWTDISGARRYELGMDFLLKGIELNDDLSELHVDGRLTDTGELALSLLPAKDDPINITREWLSPGTVDINWDRRGEDGRLIPPGYYRLKATARSTYDQPPVALETAPFYMPLYFYEDCGAAAAKDAHLTRGGRDTFWGIHPEFTTAFDDVAVVYTFPGVNPQTKYEVRLNFFVGKSTVVQEVYADDVSIHPPTEVEVFPTQTEWLEIPASALVDGELELRIVKTGGSAPASVSQIWLREADHDPANPPVIDVPVTATPTEFGLRQNYPNPLSVSGMEGSAATTFQFSLPEGHSGATSLSIFNIVGQKVRELINDDLSSGVYRQIWNGLDEGGRPLASGIYIYQLRAGAFAETRKLILMK